MEESKDRGNAGGQQQVIAIQGYCPPTEQELLSESNCSDWMNSEKNNSCGRLSEDNEGEECKGMIIKKNE